MAMNPFRLFIRLQTPIHIGHHPVRLDGLVWHALYCHLGCPQKALQGLGDYLSTHEYNQEVIYKAGSLRFGVLGEITSGRFVDNVIGLKAIKIGNMRSGSDLNPDNFKPNGRGGKAYTKVIKAGGSYKPVMRENDVYFANYLVFDGVGDGDRIADLIDFYVPAIGVNANNGYGTIGNVVSKRGNEDLSLVNELGFPSRPIPKALYEELTNKTPYLLGKAILRPPFRNQPEFECALPQRINKLLINNPGV
jgi:hypothetical protein